MGTGHSHVKRPKTKSPDIADEAMPAPVVDHNASLQHLHTSGMNQHKTSGTTNQKDIMISYSHQDSKAMRSIRELLESSNISAWVDETGLTPGNAFLREIGEAIVDCSMFLVVLSLDSVCSKYCQDEVSLAYISNKNIFAVALNSFDELTPVMDLGMKLTLSGMQWHFITDGENINEQLEPLVTSIKTALEITKQNKLTDVDQETGVSEDEDGEGANFIMNKQALKTLTRTGQRLPSSPDEEPEEGDLIDKQFWGANFGKVTEIQWADFMKMVDTKYSGLWKQMMVNDQQKNLLFHLMSVEMGVKKGVLSYTAHKRFCTRDRENLPLSQAIRLYAAETYAMKEVFDVNSSVRLSAISNLGKYQSKAVIDSLLDLLEREDDPDVMVVAAISLAHAASGLKVFKRRAEDSLLICLDHSDRLVRESGCLALGRLKSKRAIQKLVALWRNDTISSVRDAAQIAINQVGGEDATQALHVTKVLTEEIQLLKK